MWIWRARGHARRSQWGQAAAAYGRAPESRPIADDTFEQACALLLAGDRPGYLRLLGRLAARADSPGDPFTLYILTRTFSLSSEPADQARAVQWGQALSARASAPWYSHALGLAYYRAGQYDLAVRKFLDSERGAWTYRFLNWLGLALAQWRLGHEDDARQWLRRTSAYLNSIRPATPDRSVGLLPADWMEVQLLLPEARALIEKPPADK